MIIKNSSEEQILGELKEDIQYVRKQAKKLADKSFRDIRKRGVFKSAFLIDKLFVMMDLPVSKLTIDVVDSEMKYAGALLNMGKIDIRKLSPYGPNGIAIRGELDYKGKKL